MGALFHPLEEIAVTVLIKISRQSIDLKPGPIDDFPHFGGNGAPHRACIFARTAEAAIDAGRIIGIEGHVTRHISSSCETMFFLISRSTARNIEWRIPEISLRPFHIQRYQRRAMRNIQNAGGILRSLNMARHPK